MKPEYSKIIKEDYELYKPAKQIRAVLILFDGYPEVAQDIKREFEIFEIAKKMISLLYFQITTKNYD